MAFQRDYDDELVSFTEAAAARTWPRGPPSSPVVDLVTRAFAAIGRARLSAARSTEDDVGTQSRYGRLLHLGVSWENAIHEGAGDGEVRPENGAALGALREIVRVAWRDPTIHLVSWRDGDRVRWFVDGLAAPRGRAVRDRGYVDGALGSFDSEFEALVVALEAAPV